MSSLTLFHNPSDSSDNDHLNHSLSTAVFPWNDTWILPILILCSIGILCTMIIALIFICLSYRRLNGHFLLTNLFLCFSIIFIYLIIIICFIRANEIFCGLREFLSQFAYALLYSALLCRYIMQWLGSRILSKRTKKLTSLLIYLLLIFIQIPIGILWWYFTVPRACQQRRMNILLSGSKLPEFHFHFHKPVPSSSALKPCSNRCVVDYRFYATLIYPMIELILCTIIATCLFLCRHCHRRTPSAEKDEEKVVSINGNNSVLNFFNMFAFISIDLIWLIWTMIYYFTHPFFIFPALILGMFIIATICLLFILVPHVYYYSKIKLNDMDIYQTKHNPPATTLYSNKLAATDDINDQELLLGEKSKGKKTTHPTNGSELSYEIGESGTFLPITRTPKGPFKVSTPSDKLDSMMYNEHGEIPNSSNQGNGTKMNEMKINPSFPDLHNRQDQRLHPPNNPLQRQSTSSSIASDFVTPVTYRNPHADIPVSSSSMYHSAYPPTRRDETIIPILCTAERPRTSTPVQMRVLVNSPSSSVPTTRRIHSGSDLRHVRHPYHRIYPPPPPPPTTPPYYSPQPQQYLFVDPYRTMPSRIGGNTWHSVLLQPGSTAYPYSSSIHRRFHADHRSLSQRLWDIDSGDDDDDDLEEDIIKVAGRESPPKEQHYPHDEDNILLHIDDDDDDEENSYKKQYAHV